MIDVYAHTRTACTSYLLLYIRMQSTKQPGIETYLLYLFITPSFSPSAMLTLIPVRAARGARAGENAHD